MHPYSNEWPAQGSKASGDSVETNNEAWYSSLAVSDEGNSSAAQPFEVPFSIEDEYLQNEHRQDRNRQQEHRQQEHQQPTYPNIPLAAPPKLHQVSPSTLVHLPARHKVMPVSSSQPSPSSVDGIGAPRLSGRYVQSTTQPISRTSDFDMTRALWLVTTRKSPEVTLGPVDMSCAFVACDVTQDDCPVIYVSETFQNLTGYSKHELIGRNCRLLQAPDGNVEVGTMRQFVDNDAVLKLKQGVMDRRPVQQSLMNYRKGGKPFLNLLTMIPIPWDTEEIKYIVGFQIDLVQSPSAISNTDSGILVVDYRRSGAVWTPPVSQLPDFDDRRHFSPDDVSIILEKLVREGSISQFYASFWPEVLLGNLDGVVHILSLKGVFLYVSSACGNILEYDTTDLLGNSIASICHPSDVVSLTREIKNATAEEPVNMVFRIRRKGSGYMWFESYGSLFQEGSGRKYVILLGKERPVFSIGRRDFANHGGIGDSDLWAKLSTSGAILYVSANARSLIRQHPNTLIGTSIQNLMHEHSRPAFNQALDSARRRTISVSRHDVLRQGRYIQAETTLYPGDSATDQRPSFLLAQIRLAKPLATASVTSVSTPGSGTDQLAGPISERSSVGGVMGEPRDVEASSDDFFDELSTTRCSSWQFELRWMERKNQTLAEELAELLSRRKKRRRRRGVDNTIRDCANCHTQNTPEWRRGPSGQRDLCNRCGLQWAKQMGRISSRKVGGSADRRGKSSVASTASPATFDQKESGSTSNPESSNANDTATADMAGSVPSLDAA